MASISIIMSTARDDYPILGLPETHIFDPLVRSLNKQTFKDFELVIVDSLYDDRDTSPLDDATFHVNRVPPKPSPWLDLGMFHSANNFNTGLIHAEGELIVKIDDCMEIVNENHLQRIWDLYNKGFTPLQTFMYYFKGKPAKYRKNLVKEIISMGSFSEYGKSLLSGNWDGVYQKGEQIRDTRLNLFDTQTKTCTHKWYYGVSSVSLRNALAVNGYDETMDGCRGLEDIDFGLRLELYGVNPFLIDKDLMLIEHVNDELSKKVITRERRHFRNGYLLYYLHKINKRIQANKHILTDQEIEFIRTETINPTLPGAGRPLTRKYEYDPYLFDVWVKNQRTFDLQDLRFEA